MSPELPPPDIAALPEAERPQPHAPPPESYPFWGYLDLLGFVLLALLGSLVVSLLGAAVIDTTHVKRAFVQLPAQVVLYGFLLGALAVIFRRYYGQPFWRSLRWITAKSSTRFVVTCGVVAAFAVMVASVLLRTPDNDSPMKELLSDPASAVMIAIMGTTLAPMCEEIVFRGFLQPLLVRSLGVLPGILLAAAPFGLMHLPEYGYSWRHALLISAAGAGFGWMRQRTGSTKASAVMHAAYNGVFFLLLAAQPGALHARWAGR
jgi:hypothetical protein